MADTNDGLVATVKEIVDLVKEYAQQETVEPLKRAGGYLAWGMAGSLMMGLGLVFLAMAGLRALQTETGDAFDGTWNFVPYLIVLVGALVAVAIAAKMITSGKEA